MSQLLANRYILGELLGKGGMGEVYLATDTQANAVVAVKRLNPARPSAENNALERFEREAEALRQLNHPNIVHIIEKAQQDDAHFIVMEYVPNGSLQDHIEQAYRVQNTIFPISLVVSSALEIADALTRAHHLRIIHRDLKPANVLVTADGSMRLTDFGIAHFTNTRRITGTDSVFGTLDYMSPEALQSGPIDQRTDIWAFGVLLFEMLTGRLPFLGEQLSQVITAILTQPTPDLEALRPDAPLALIDLVYRMLAKQPERRIASARLVGAALEAIQNQLDPNPADSKPNLETNLIALRAASTTRHTHTNLLKVTPVSDSILKNNVPSPLTPLIGRETELQALRDLLANGETRLVTLLAPGGMGKTRLALEVARSFAEQPIDQSRFSDGVYWVELAPLGNSDAMAAAIAKALQLNDAPDGSTSYAQVIDALAHKQALLIFDNFEHLAQSSHWVGELLNACPQLTVLATSRERLNLHGETLFRIEGLSFAHTATLDQLLEHSAVKLFIHAARYTRPDFTLGDPDLAPLLSILTQIDGLPLGIVLAAGWVELLSLPEIAAELARSIDILETSAANIPERQRSIRAVFDYSWALLDETQRAIYRKLSVFQGGFTREAARAIVGADLRVLGSLVNKSLLRRNPNTGRYDSHELLRQYAAEKGELAGDMKTIRDAHSRYFLNYMYERRIALQDQNFEPQARAFDQLESEMQNVRAAWSHALDMGDFPAIQRAISGLIPTGQTSITA